MVLKSKNKKFWVINAKTEEKPAELLLYGPIASYSWWGDEVSPKQFKADLDALGDIDELAIYINSDGGDVFAGQAIYSMLKRHKATKKVYIDGLAASIASVIAMAGDTVHMPRNAMMMIHKAWTWGMGNADDFRKLADDLDKIGETIVNVYEEKSGQDRQKIIDMMTAETWLTADDALECCLIDQIEESKAVAASVRDGFLVLNGQEMDLKRYKNAPKLAFLDPKAQEKPGEPPAPPQEPEDDLEFTFNKKLLEVKSKKYKLLKEV